MSESAIEIAHNILKKNKVQNAQKSIKGAKITLIILGVLCLSVAIIAAIFNPTPYKIYFIVGYGVLGIAYLLFGIFIKKNPFLLSLLGLILYLSVQILVVLFSGIEALLSGWLIKGIIIFFLARTIFNVKYLTKEKIKNDEILDSELIS